MARIERQWISKALSEERFVPYLAECGGDVPAAWESYVRNVNIAMAFYLPLHFTEVALRNSLHDELEAHFGRPDWWTVAPLDDHGQRLVKQALEKVATSRTRQRRGGLLTKLTLGFWVSLVSHDYDRSLWVPSLHRAFPNYRGRRDDLHAELREVLALRNCVMHHERLREHDLKARYEAIYRVLNHLSPELAAAIREIDKVPDIMLTISH